ncbi:hypothetical protein KAU32_08595 [bacterium]|nr:hypothetical protein [bacterium]
MKDNGKTKPFRFHTNSFQEEHKIMHPIHLDKSTLESFAKAAKYARQRIDAKGKKTTKMSR